MEDRSSRRMRTLVTRMVHRDLSAKKNAGALISMMARSPNRSNQRPDTLMQDRKPPDRRNLSRRTAGPYIRVISAVPDTSVASPLRLGEERGHAEDRCGANDRIGPSCGRI